MPKVFFFIGFLMAVTYSIPGTADMMDDLKNSQEMSSFLLEGKLEEAAEIFSHIEDPNMKEISAVTLQGQFLMRGDVTKGESFLEYILNEDIRQISYQSLATQSILQNKDCTKAKKYIDLLLDPQIQELMKMSYKMTC
tara:strand:- start:213 stop:626 length:414 start_codon:yes stop_codon:yes gene_type:complete